MHLHRNTKGIVGLPLKLVVFMTIVAIGVPVVWGAAQGYSRTQVEKNIEMEIRFIENTIKDVYVRGEENRRIIDINLPSGTLAKLEWIEIGGSDGDPWSKVSSIRYKMAYKTVQSIVISHPNIPITNRSEGSFTSLRLYPGSHKLLIFNSQDDFNSLEDQRIVEIGKIG